MAVLDAEKRKEMPRSEFAQPEKRGFPLSDKTHDRMAISGATRSEHAGNISQSKADRIKAEARAKLHGGDGKDGGHMDHKAAIAKMHPEHLHKMVQHAMSGKAGPEMQQMAQQAMAGGQDSTPPGEGQQGPAASPNKMTQMFAGANDNDGDETAPPSRTSMFAGSRGGM